MSLGLQLILSTTLVAVPPGCSWAHPGANPYRGEPAAVLAHFDLAEATRSKLRALMQAHRSTDVVTITRDDIVGSEGGYTGLREMHSGHGRVCHGEVDRSAWGATRRERALVYCADDACVIVPTICNNVSLVSRKAARVALPDDSPIDIEPAAGPPHASPEAGAPPSPAEGPLQFLPPVGGGGDAPGVPVAPGTPGGSDGGSPLVGEPVGGVPTIGGGGGLPCCDIGAVGPGTPGSPGTPPVISTVPEAPASSLLAVGLALMATLRRRRRSAQARSRSGCACAGHGDTKKASTIAASTSATVAGFQRGE